ncbi:MAG: hypothetical protein JW717_03060 [Marinilabiliaceae bacterium]|nr:hypothetical protein [Marinilabiliaceae bacterium]
MCKINTLLIIIISLLIFQSETNGQNEENKPTSFFELETGIGFYDSNMQTYDFFRNSSSVYYQSDRLIDNISSFYYQWYIGAKVEFRLNDNKHAFLTGLRIKKCCSSLGKLSSDYESSEYFFLLYNKNEASSEFLKIKEINQASYYIGIPLELKRIMVNKKYYRFFFKAAFDLNYRLHTTTDVVFFNNLMEEYEDGVINKFDEPADFVSVFYPMVGFNFGREDKSGLIVEFALPSLFVTDKSVSGLVKPDVGCGVQLNIQVPF